MYCFVEKEQTSSWGIYFELTPAAYSLLTNKFGYPLVLAWPRLHKAMLDPFGAEPFAGT